MDHNNMPTYEIEYAQEHLDELYDRAVDGDEVIIAVGGVPKVRLERKWKKRVHQRAMGPTTAKRIPPSGPFRG